VTSTGNAVMRRRAFAIAPGLVGVALLARPDQIGAAVSRKGARPADWIVRLLGARMAGQAVVTLARPSTTVAALGFGTDVSHAASMVWLARRMPRYRRAAIASAAVASAFAGAGLVTAFPGRHRS
jgi:hypothetical protein